MRWVDRTLFIKQLNLGILVVQIYVDDIVFGSTSSDHMQEFVSQMKNEFEMSMVREFTYFLVYKWNKWRMKFLLTKVSMPKV